MVSLIKKMYSMLFVFITIFITGCDENSSTINKSAEPSEKIQQTNTQEQGLKDDTDGNHSSLQSEQVKVNAYVACYNQIDNVVRLSTQRYFSAFPNIENGPTGKETSPQGFITVDSSLIADCKVEVFNALAIQPEFVPMDFYAKPFVDSVIILGNVSNQILRYYEQGDYKDDNFEKGKKLHKEFVSAFNQYEKFSSLLVYQIELYNDERTQNVLIELEKNEGKSLDFYMLAIITKAKLINRLLAENEFTASKVMIETEDIQKMIDELSDLIEIKRKENNRPSSSYSFMISDGNKYVTAVKQRIRRLKDKTPYSKFEKQQLGTPSEWLVEGSEGKVREHYNAMVKNYNRS